jgi:hypothetical protein
MSDAAAWGCMRGRGGLCFPLLTCLLLFSAVTSCNSTDCVALVVTHVLVPFLLSHHVTCGVQHRGSFRSVQCL